MTAGEEDSSSTESKEESVQEGTEESEDDKIQEGSEKEAGEGDEGEESSEHPPKFKFECLRTGDCCKRETVPVSLNDLQRWVKDQTIFRVVHLLQIAVVDENEVQLQLVKNDDGYCSLYHRDNKACTIHYNKPLYCKSYPLGFNGEKYIIKSKECTGLGKGKMTKDQLKELRDVAFEDFVGRRQVIEVLPILQSIFFRQLSEESQRIMDKLSPEEKEKIDEMFKSGESEEPEK
ncbi:MAG: YkgJ family cysteine cluster protein [Thermoplasmata archaeon]|nr:MAG: YkgJ family cysteine cluster protein [Thermoplasmata archaeon]